MAPTPKEVADERGPDSPTDLTKQSGMYVLRKTAREFSKDQCTDLAAALTYYAVLALFPAMIALLSLVGLFGQGPQTVETLLGILNDIGAGSVVDSARAARSTELAAAPQAAGVAFVVGLRGALWSASGYVGVVRPRDEPDVRDPRGPPGLEAAPADAAGHPGRAACSRRPSRSRWC